jgi:tetratricopeptide (TPR) repeat protein
VQSSYPFEYDWAGDYSGKLAPVEKDLLVGYVDGTGKVKIPFKFKDAREFAEGLAPATLDAKKWGYISEAGDFVIAPVFQRAFRFDGGRALVYIDSDLEPITAAKDPVQLQAAARQARDAGQPNEARAACNAIIAAAPNSESAKQAQLLLTVGLPDHDLKPEIIDMNNKATFLIQTQKNKEAEALFKQVIAAEPRFFTAAGAYSYLLLSEQRYDEGIELLKKTLANHPSYARGYWRLGQLYAGKGLQDQAATSFAKAKELDPYDTEYMQ